VDGQLPKAITSGIEFAEIPATTDSLASISTCLAHSSSFPPRDAYSVYRVVEDLCAKEDGLKTCWAQHSRAKKVYRLFRAPETMASEHQIFLGDKDYTKDFGDLLFCLSERAGGAEDFLRNLKGLYRKLGVATRPGIPYALNALARLTGTLRTQKVLYAGLVDLLADSQAHQDQANLEGEDIPDFHILTCSGMFEPISRTFRHDVLNKARLLSVDSRAFVIDDREQTTSRLVRLLEKMNPGVVKSLSDIAEIGLVRLPEKTWAKKSAEIVTGPWEDWFKQLASEGSKVREMVREALGVSPPIEPFQLVPVESLAIQYALPTGAKVVPSEEWEGPPVLGDGEKKIFAQKGILERDYVGKSEDLEAFDKNVACQVARLLVSARTSGVAAIVEIKDVVETIQRIVRGTLERPGVVLEQLRREKQDHFFHQYQDQTAHPEFAEFFEEYQRLSGKAKERREELETKMRQIIQTRFVEERRSQIKGYGYDEFSVFAELIQNAEDAYSQRATIGLEAPPRKAVVFRYEMESNGLALIVEHWGRPFNLWRYGGIEEPNFRRDVEGVLRSAGSFKPHSSVYLLTDKPRIHSGQWHFEINSACIPMEVSVPEDFGRDLTRIVLPLTKGVKEEMDPKGERLANLLPFLRNVNEIELRNSDGISSRALKIETVVSGKTDDNGITVEIVRLAPVDYIRGREIRMIRLRRDEGSEQLGIYISPEGLPSHWEDAFEKDIFAVLPLSVHLGCGLAVSNLFDLQSGRTHLIDPEGNTSRFEAVARLLYALPKVIQLCVKENVGPSDIMLKFWTLLRWNRGDRDAFAIRRELANVLARMAQKSEIIPTLNPSKCVALEKQTVFTFMGVPHDFAEELVREGAEISVEGQSIKLSADNVVPEPFREAYDQTCRVSGFEAEKRPQAIGWAEIGEIIQARNLFAKQHHLLLAMARNLPEEALATVREWLAECLLEASDGSLDIARNLLPHRFPGCDYLPSQMMKSLHEDYDSDSVELLKRAGLPSRPSLEQVSEWIRKGLDQNECVNLLRYLGEAGRWRRDFYNVGELLTGAWFGCKGRRLTTDEAFRRDFIPEDILGDQPFQAWLGIRRDGEEQPPPPPVPVSDVKTMLMRVYDWWEAEGSFYLQEYETQVYPRGEPPVRRKDFYERGDNERRGWLTLLLLGCSHTMGRTRPGQHRHFLLLCEERGWFQVFADPASRAEDWIAVLEQYLEEQVQDAVYYQWMKQFISIYQVAKYLNEYVGCLLDIDRYPPGRLNIDEIVEPLTSSVQQHGGYEAPSLKRALGIGLCFVLREMRRLGLISDPRVNEFCYVPAQRVRDMFVEDLGCKELAFENKTSASKMIHDFLVEHLGTEMATFHCSFDLPFLTLVDNDDLRTRYLRLSSR